jgi:hypothetical protein
MLQHIARGYIHALFRYRPGTICNATSLQSNLPTSQKPLTMGGTTGISIHYGLLKAQQRSKVAGAIPLYNKAGPSGSR